jgi:hypothetical protein
MSPWPAAQHIAIINPVAQVDRRFDFSGALVLFTVYNRGNQIAEIKLGDVVKSEDEMSHTPGDDRYQWGGFLGFEPDGRFKVLVYKSEKTLVYDYRSKTFTEVVKK